MGCGQSACADDDREWHALAKAAGIADTRWDCYSHEAAFSKIGYSKHKYTGRRLKLFVRHQMELQALTMKQADEVTDLQVLVKLEAQFA